MCDALKQAGFAFTPPEGAYYILADYSSLSDLDDVAFSHWLAKEVGVATVPGSSFHVAGGPSRKYVRFAFCKKAETLNAAAERLATMSALT